ncbi:hypothetical protein BDQ17DRAFT_966822 [Cyathus striatus]|nr:hypothetical protein BDQ17DRAFT_966822 [Cyathus striatus]
MLSMHKISPQSGTSTTIQDEGYYLWEPVVNVDLKPKIDPRSKANKIYNKETLKSTSEKPVDSQVRWECIVCSTWMDVQDKENHLSGKKHKSKVQKKDSQNDSTNGSPQSNKSNKVQHHDGDKLDSIAEPVDLNSKWRCIICGASMAVRDKVHHLSGKRHREKERLQALNSQSISASMSHLSLT